MNKWFVLPFLFLLCFCQAPDKKFSAVNTSTMRARKSNLITKANLVDSLKKYKGLDEFLSKGDSGRYVLYGKRSGNDGLGIIALTDTALWLFQIKGSALIMADTAAFSDYATDFEEVDLNGDSQDDFIVYGFGKMHGQRRPYVFMSDKVGKFHYRSDLALYNITYDAFRKELHSFYLGGVNSVHSKEVFRWQGDSAVQTAGIEYNMENGEIELYKMRAGKRWQQRIYHNRQEIVFDTALFKIEPCL